MAALLDQAFGRPSRGNEDAPVMASLDTTRSDATDGEGDDDEEPVVKAKPVRASLQTAAIPVAAPKEEKASRGSASSHWGVQVGAFSSKAAGNKAVSQAVKQAPFLLRTAKPSVVQAKTGKETVYRARLTGLDEKDARKACAVLTKHGHHCVAVSPGERG
jgi:D-alanyl-D-alanine carboxypeptidase